MIIPPSEEVSAAITAHVLRRIAQRELALLRLKLTVICVFLVAIIGAFVPVISDLSQNLSSSGISSYLSIIISDSQYVLANWSDLLFSIVSSWPIISTAAVVALLLLMTISIRGLKHYTSSFSTYRLLLS